jgi:predicted RNA-binding protein (virulence factor B family)
MVLPGTKQTLTVLREMPQGFYLNALNLGEVLMPRKYASAGLALGDEVTVFLHHDSEDRLVATTQMPVAMLGQIAGFQVVGIRGGVGAFLDWGLEKDLLLPLREQTRTPVLRDWIVAMVVLDDRSGRLIATMRFAKQLNQTEPPYTEGEKVEVVVVEETELGYKAVIRHSHWGLLYKNETASPLVPGDELDVFVRKVRPDGKIDLSFDAAGYQRVKPLADIILDALKDSGGSLPINDKTPPETIREQFQASKKAFKQALGALLRARRIEFTADGITLATSQKSDTSTNKSTTSKASTSSR